MAMPPMNLNLNVATSSRAENGPVSFNKSGNVYNYGGAGSGSAAVPGWMLAAAAVAAVLWFAKKKG